MIQKPCISRYTRTSLKSKDDSNTPEIRKKKKKTGKATMPMAAYIHALLSALHEQHKMRVSDEGQKKKKKSQGWQT